MVKKKIALFGLTAITVGLVVGLVSAKKSSAATVAEGCTHQHVEHYSETADHAEHWACCECHTAWSDELLTDVIGNTVSDRSHIDMPRIYSYNKTTGKVEYGREGRVAGQISPVAVINSMEMHANNNNVFQFKGEALEAYVTTDLQIMNPENVVDTFGLTSGKEWLSYWNDSHTFGFAQGGAFASFGFGKYVYGENLVLRNGSDYYVVELIGAVASERIGIFRNISGFIENNISGTMTHNSNYYVDFPFTMNSLLWQGDYNGTDWRYGTGTSYVINKISGGVTSEYVHVTNDYPANGTWPAGIVEVSTTNSGKIARFGFDYNYVATGDQFVLKEGSILTDEVGNAALVREDITVIFDGSKFVGLPLTYSYNESSKKVEVRKGDSLKQVIAPTAYISSMKFHGNNSNVFQFKGEALEAYVTTDLQIMNPENVVDTFGLTSGKEWLSYWNDSHTFGFAQGGAFASFGFGKYVVGKDLVLKDGSNYYVIGLIGAAASERIGIFTTVVGLFDGTLVNSFEHNSNYYADLGAKVDTTFWSGGHTMGTDYAYNGGTCYHVDKETGGVASEFAYVTNDNPANGTFLAGIKEATIYCDDNYVRLGIIGSMITTGDKIILKAGSILTDDGLGKDSVLVLNDIVLTFTGSAFTL